MTEALNGMADAIRAALGPEAVVDIAYGDITVTVPAAGIVDVVKRLRDDPALRFINIIDVCGVDYPSREQRFEVVYHFLSPTKNARVRVKVATDEVTPVPSICGEFPAPIGSSARPTTSTASCSPATRSSGAC